MTPDEFCSPGPAGVIAAHAVMGIGAALIMPATLCLLTATFPVTELALR